MRIPRRAEDDAVVVSGAGVVCSIGSDVPSFTDALRAGRTGITADDETSDAAPQLGAAIRSFDPDVAVSSRAALPEALRRRARRAALRATFPVQVALAAALQAWESAGLAASGVPARRVGIIVAGSSLTERYADSLRAKFFENPAYLPPSFALRAQDTDHVGVLSEVFGVQGEGYTVGGASAGGNVGIINASRLIELGAVDACLVVGALADLTPMAKRSFLNIGAMAANVPRDRATTVCRPFDEARCGFVYGQGSACLVLESERSARRRGAAFTAELAGYALGLDANSMADPSEEGEARVMTDAVQRAGLELRDVAYVNAHGTASRLGDETEIRALRRAFGASFTRPWVNATKGFTGHCLHASGVIEAVATIAQMRGGFVHPNANLSHPIDAECRFAGAAAEPAEIGAALSNSFGFGGINSSIVLVNRSGRERARTAS